MNQTKKFFLYARKSTDEAERQVLSIEAQMFELREFAKKENLNIVREFVESKTAKEPGREIFNDMVAQIEQGGAEGILAWHPDRLARNSVDGGRIIYAVDTGKITALKFPTFWFDPTPQGKFMLSIAFGQSKYYVDNLSENVKRGLRQKLRNGSWPAWAPLGYQNDKVNKRILVDKEKAIFVKKTFETYATGNYTLKEIRKIINSLGLVGKQNKLLSISNFQYMLTNPFYYGMMRYVGELYEGKHKPIITKKLFDQVQEVMKQKSKPKNSELKPYIYRGVFHCQECGCFITTETKKGHNYLRCTKRKEPCSQKYTREEFMTEQIKKEIQKVSLPSDWATEMLTQLENEKSEKAQSENSFAQKWKDEMREVEEKLDSLLDMILEKSISQDEYNAKKQKILNHKIEISEKLKAFEQKSHNRFDELSNFRPYALFRFQKRLENPGGFQCFGAQRRGLQKPKPNFPHKVGEEGFGPPIVEPKSTALPLGYSPTLGRNFIFLNFQ
ncbi:MAG: Recombinase [Candidatus Moranbacteria bacterium GW2011_GWA2_39_41]|nr:MAG: Recombinase [Candidatus Moranbacteria bacterium GW2011_GWA2_39_41]